MSSRQLASEMGEYKARTDIECSLLCISAWKEGCVSYAYNEITKSCFISNQSTIDHHIDASQHYSVYEGNNNAMIIFQYRLIRVCAGVIYL